MGGVTGCSCGTRYNINAQVEVFIVYGVMVCASSDNV